MTMKKNLFHIVIPAVILALSVVFGYLVSEVENFNRSFLVAVCLLFALAIFYRNNFNKPLVIIARTLLGALFIFSGFVKGVDPLGTQYQMLDYFTAYGTEWANPLAGVLSILLITAEFVVGAALILNVRLPLSVWGAILLMVFFTATTFYDAFAVKLFGATQDPVPDCGCFGKAIILTNFQTFYKNIIIDTLLIIVFFGKYRVRNTFSLKNEIVIISAITALFVGFQFYNLRHLPVIDFMDWEKGAKLNPPKTEPVTYLLQYKNKTTNEVQEFDSKALPADVVSNWEYVDMKINDPNPANLMIPFFTSQDADGQDVRDMIAENPDYSFIVAMYDLKKAKLKKIDEIFALQDFAREKGFEFVFLFDLGATNEAIADFKKKTGREDMDIYFSDDKSIKAIVRSNPGVILLKDGVVVDKWAWRDVPSVEELKITE